MLSRVWLLKDPQREKRLFLGRAIIAGLLSSALLLLLLARMYYLQIDQHGHYTTLSTNNRVTLQPLAPTRGLIFDRHGTILAENLPSYSLDVVQERVTDLEQTLQTIGQLIALESDDLDRFHKERQRSRRFRAVPLRLRLTEEEVALISVNRYRLPGVEINARLVRHYPYAELTAHVVGYVGRINEHDLLTIDNSDYANTSHIGKRGVERSHEDELHGRVGHQQVEVNARGRVLRVLEKTPPIPGNNLTLNIDINLQRVATEAFGRERGALVAIDPHTGAVLTMVSTPSYDSNLFVNGISSRAYNALLNSRDQPLFNRTLQGQYPPGSTTKPFVGLAGLHYKVINKDDKVFCPGYYSLENSEHRYRDWKKEGHGTVDLESAIVESCDVFFYDLAHDLTIDRLSGFMHRFGFGEKTEIDIGSERAGLMPTQEWKRTTYNKPWYPGETLITGIGQGFSLATPLQLAVTTATLANRGTRFQPQVIAAIEEQNSGLRTTIAPRQIGASMDLKENHWQRIHHAMTQVIHGVRGTARRLGHNLGYRMAAKTGTAQVFGIKQDEEYNVEDITKRLRDHALFIAFAPAENPQIAVALIVENGGSGGAVAGPIARQVIDHYLKTNQEQPTSP